MEDILKEFDESIERDEEQVGMTGDLQAEETGAAGDTPEGDGQAQDAGTDDLIKGETGSTKPQDTGDDPEDESGSEEDQNDEASGPGDKKGGPFSKKNKKTSWALEKQLEKVEEKAAEMTDRYQRLMAEFENARKRMDKEKGQMFDIGAKSVLEKLLPVVDNFERGLGALSDVDKGDPFVQGVEKIYQQLITVLTDVGVSPIEATGKEFNPDPHNAVMHVEDEELPDNVVAEEFQKGYMYKDSVLRYSMVKVAN